MFRSALSMILVLFLIVGGMVVLGHTMFESQIFEIIRVGVVIPEGESEMKMISQFISSMDSVKSICSFSYMPQKEALEELCSGEIQAVISLPESLYQDIYRGQSAEVTVYFPENSSLNIKVFREIINDGVNLLKSAEAGVFASRDVSKIYESNMEQHEVAKYISYAYLEAAFERGDIFNESVMVPFGTVNLYQYYAASGLSILLLMLGISFSYLYPEQNKIIEQKLCIMGLGAIKMSFIKVLIMTGILWFFGCLSYVGLYIVSSYTGMFSLWMEGRIFGGFFMMALVLAVYFHLIYSVFKMGYQGSVFLLSINILMLICSGTIIPVVYLPDFVKMISRYMPLNYLNQYCAELLFETVNGTMMIGVCIWIIIVFAIGVLFTWNNLSYGIRFNSKRG